jgi:hypothetical protein
MPPKISVRKSSPDPSSFVSTMEEPSGRTGDTDNSPASCPCAKRKRAAPLPLAAIGLIPSKSWHPLNREQVTAFNPSADNIIGRIHLTHGSLIE